MQFWFINAVIKYLKFYSSCVHLRQLFQSLLPHSDVELKVVVSLWNIQDLSKVISVH